MKPVNLWVVLGMSLLLVTGVMAQPPLIHEIHIDGELDPVETTTRNAQTGQTVTQGSTQTSIELPQINLLKQSRLRSIGAQAQAKMPDTGDLNDLVPLVKGQGNVINRLGLTNDNDLIF